MSELYYHNINIIQSLSVETEKLFRKKILKSFSALQLLNQRGY